jgi:hypothetical protein
MEGVIYIIVGQMTTEFVNLFYYQVRKLTHNYYYAQTYSATTHTKWKLRCCLLSIYTYSP